MNACGNSTGSTSRAAHMQEMQPCKEQLSTVWNYVKLCTISVFFVLPGTTDSQIYPYLAKTSKPLAKVCPGFRLGTPKRTTQMARMAFFFCRDSQSFWLSVRSSGVWEFDNICIYPLPLSVETHRCWGCGFGSRNPSGNRAVLTCCRWRLCRAVKRDAPRPNLQAPGLCRLA